MLIAITYHKDFTFSLKFAVDMQELWEVKEKITFLFKGSYRTFQLG